MKTFKQLTEAKETVVFGFGRFNPPTTGHEKLIEKVASVAGSNPFFIYPSHTTGPKDPLPHAKKVAWMRKMFPKYKKNIIADNNAKTAIHIAEKLYRDGYKNLIMVAGSDRLKEFDTLLQRYNDAPDKKGNQLFKFDSVKVVSAGERDPDAEGVEGMSASKMRTAAEKGDFDSFKTGIPATLNDADKKKLYFEVRKNMGIREEGGLAHDPAIIGLGGGRWRVVGDAVEQGGLKTVAEFVGCSHRGTLGRFIFGWRGIQHDFAHLKKTQLLRAGGQQSDLFIGNSRRRHAPGFEGREFTDTADRGVDGCGHISVSVRQKRRHTRHFHADRDPGRPAQQAVTLDLSDAAGLWLADRGHHHADRYVAQSAHFHRPGAAGSAALPPV